MVATAADPTKELSCSIAAAFGLKVLIESWGPRAVIGYGGIIGRAENRAMVKSLRIKVFPTEMLRPNEYDLVAVVDAQPCRVWPPASR